MCDERLVFHDSYSDTSLLRLFLRTLSVECCYQNVGIATSVALTMFQGDELSSAMAVPLYYGLIEAAILGVYCIIAWKGGWTKAPSKVSFCTMISTSYEVLIVEHLDLTAIEVSLPKHETDVNEKSKNGTIYIKYRDRDEEGDEEEDFQMGCMHIDLHLPPHSTKEASGYLLPEVPEDVLLPIDSYREPTIQPGRAEF